MLTRTLALVMTALTLAVLGSVGDADAARLGGGRSFGAQRPSIAPSMPAPAPRPNVTAPSPTAPATATPRPGGASRWLGPIAGIAAGLGLAALLSHFGLSEAAAGFLLIALAVFAVILVARLIFARRTGATAPSASYSGSFTPPPAERSAPSSGSAFEPVMRPPQRDADPYASQWGGAPVAQRWPAGFDPAPFLEQARRQFNTLQAAYDRGDRAMLRDVTTPEMYREIARDLDARGPHIPTEVVRLDPEILQVTTEANQHWASVRFTGLTREDGATTPQPFDEIWNLVKPVDGSSGWLLAGIQQAAHATS
ncbi:MAG TPA: TIM44-like domain-containing protein [Casimicrobiaceae bacterium]|nr:TIM44-like domain-containing protein [Casimicrobiaceae bacterium]